MKTKIKWLLIGLLGWFIILCLGSLIFKDEIDEYNKEIELKKEIEYKENQKELFIKKQLELDKLNYRKSWADSLIKAAKGLVYERYESDFKDSIFIYLTLAPSKNIDVFEESELPFLIENYKSYMKGKVGDDYNDEFNIIVVPGKEYQALEAKYSKINKLITNGRMYSLETLIQTQLNDPDSFEHVETQMEDKGKYMLVRIIARCKNAFGAKILTSFDVKLDFDGSVLSLKENCE